MSAQTITTQELQILRTAEIETVPVQAVSDSSLLNLLASLDRGMLAQLIHEQHCAAGEVVFSEGEPGDAMYLIWSGRVIVIKGDVGAPTILGFRGPGESIGEMALLEGQPRSATIIALEPTRLLRIERAAFAAWVNSSPEVGMRIMSSLSARLRDSAEALNTGTQVGRELIRQMSALEMEKQHLQELERLRQETSDLIVHDLRNPLGTISGALSMLEMVLPEEALETNRDLLSLATNACARMQRLVDSLLDVSRLESGQAPLQRVPVDLAALEQQAIEREGLSVAMGRVQFRREGPEALPAVLGDPEMLDRVLANLVDNAIKYTPAGGTITLGAEVQDDFVVASVSDSGPGIPPAERERIFERFTQVQGGKAGRRGFGLGLAFCRLVVEGLGGHIWVEPGPDGAGSKFAFALPRAAESAGAAN